MNIGCSTKRGWNWIRGRWVSLAIGLALSAAGVWAQQPPEPVEPQPAPSPAAPASGLNEKPSDPPKGLPPEEPDEKPEDKADKPDDKTPSPPAAEAESQPSGLPPRPASSARALLINVDDSELNRFSDRQPLDAGDEETLMHILYRLPAFPLEQFERLKQGQKGVAWQELVDQPDRFRVEMFHVTGRAKLVVKVPLVPEIASRLEFEHYFRVTMELADAPFSAVICSRKVPEAWPLDQPLDEPVVIDGLFLKVGDLSGPQPQLVFAADRVAWIPDRAEPALQIGPPQVLLAGLGFDVSLLDDVRKTNGLGITAADRECFYRMLAAVGQTQPETLRAAAPGEFAVVDLLKEPKTRHGQLGMVNGVARRVTKILVSDPDIQQRFAIDHYFQIDVFVSLGDQVLHVSQVKSDAKSDAEGPVYANNFPVTVCVRRLPKGLTESANSHDVVRIPAFFFKLWSYQSEYVSGFDKSLKQRSPMFIGLEPVVVPQPPRSNPIGNIVMAVMVAMMLGLLISFWRSYRRRRAGRGEISTRHELPPGQSLNNLDLKTRER